MLNAFERVEGELSALRMDVVVEQFHARAEVFVSKIFSTLANKTYVRSEESVSTRDSLEGSLDEVTHGCGVTLSLGVTILDTSQLQHTL